MGIGAYRHLVTLVQPAGVADPVKWYCAMQSAATQVVDGLTAFFIRGRYHPGITLETQIHFAGRAFQVQSVTDVDERQIELALMCVEVVGRHGHSVAVLRTYQQQVVADGASQFWPLDDPSGTTARNLVMATPGTISGGVTLNQPGVGTSKCMTFNGTTGKIVTASNVTLTMPLSFECYFKTSLLGETAFFGALAAYFGVGLLGATKTHYVVLYADGTSGYLDLFHGLSFVPAQWNHLVVVFAETTVLTYINGVAGTPISLAKSLKTPIVQRVCIPEQGLLYGTWFAGSMQDVAIYPRALTPAEIANHYATGIAR